MKKKNLANIGDLRLIIFLILFLLVLYTVVGTYQTPLPDSPSSLVDSIDHAPLFLPYETLLLHQDSTESIHMILSNQYYKEYPTFHLSIVCVDQYHPQSPADFSLFSFPEMINVSYGTFKITDMTLAVPLHAKITTYLCRIELEHPNTEGPSYTSLIASENLYIDVLPTLS